jgi:ATP-dependent exoDNAse (exonuclease V) alpha subunit
VPRHPIDFEQRLKELQRLKQHGKYWALKESMADIAYAYALTVHNSQGSTYGMVFGDVTQRNEKGRPINFGLCKGSYRTKDGQRILERNQLLYVLLTRASDRLIITA